MDRKLNRAFGSFSQNGTEPLNFTQLPSNILETFIPGYSIIARFILHSFGLDITLLVSIGLFLVGLTAGSRFLFRHASQFFFRWFTSSISIEDKDDLFRTLRDWIAAQDMARTSRRLTAVTKKSVGPSGQNGVSVSSEDQVPVEAIGETGLLHIGSWAARIPPRYDPRHEAQWFAHRGRWFNHRTQIREMQATPWQQSGEKQTLVLTCVGWSTNPIKELIEHVKVMAFEKERAVTVIRHPSPKEQRRFAGNWARATSRPSRSMDTVVLDPVAKKKLVNDINDYLHPSSPRWYASRGIPYRRGYLFYGPPGTGKSSLSFALAGLFGLDIYVISLSDSNFTESDLSHLFLNLPHRCIVLLEDIDSAGLHREASEESDEKTKKFGASRRKSRRTENEADSKSDEAKTATKAESKPAIEAGKTELTVEALTAALKEVTRESNGRRGTTQAGGEEKKNGVTLSGLLNAIDGVASHEGRILVMTTNHPERLDPALIRPGRVDLQVGFTLATRQQIRELFVRMYSDDAKAEKAKLGKALKNEYMNGHANGTKILDGIAFEKAIAQAKILTGNGEVDKPEEPSLEDLADQFAELMPDEAFSPAEIQDYFIQRKNDPKKAVDEAREWIRAIQEEKEFARDLEGEEENGEE